MTITEMHYDFDLKIDKVGSQSKADFNRAERDWLLNEAQNVIVKQRYSGNNPHRMGMEMNQKRMDDLSTLVVRPGVEQPGLTPSLSGEIPLSTLTFDYWFLTEGYATVTGCSDKVPLRIIQVDDLRWAEHDPFNKSSIKNGVLATIGKTATVTGAESLYIHEGDLDVNQVYLGYIKKPQQMFYGGYNYIDGTPTVQTNCELPEHIHTELVDIAVQIAAGIIEHPTYVQLKKQKVFEQE